MSVPSTHDSEILLYEAEDGTTQLDVRLEEETVWLTQSQLADLFGTTRENIVQHIHHIYDEGELKQTSTCKNFLQVRQEGSRTVRRQIPHDNLDMRHEGTAPRRQLTYEEASSTGDPYSAMSSFQVSGLWAMNRCMRS